MNLNAGNLRVVVQYIIDQGAMAKIETSAAVL
jgi:hypothetical protein